MRFVKQIARPDFPAKDFTLLNCDYFLLTMKQHKCIGISNLSDLLLKFN